MRILKQETYFPIIIGLHFVMWAVDLALFAPDLVEVHSDTLLFGELQGRSILNPSRIVGEVFSSWVVTVFAFNFLMATRLRWVERLFGGLDKMYLIHRRAGVIAVLLLGAHFVFVPRDLTEFTVGKPLGFWAFLLMLVGVVLAAAPPLKKKLPYGRWLKSHRLMGPLYVVALVHAAKVSSLIEHLPLTRVYVAAMALVGVASWIYRGFFYRAANPEREYEVSGLDSLDARTVELRLRPRGTPLTHEAGQFAFFRFPKLRAGEGHPFSIASPPDARELRIVVRALGDDTTAMQSELHVGDIAFVDGPFGHFTQSRVGDGAQLWIAGGIGITPFLGQATQLEDRRAHLVWTVNAPEDAVFADELQAVADSNPNFSFEVWPAATKGHLSADALDADLDPSATVLLCGPTAMKDALRQGLRRRGFSDNAIVDEDFAFR